MVNLQNIERTFENKRVLKIFSAVYHQFAVFDDDSTRDLC